MQSAIMLACCPLWLATVASAEPIAGKVIDAVTAEPIAGAKLTAGPQGATVSTAADGGFRLETAADSARALVLRVTAAGYQPGALSLEPSAERGSLQILLLPAGLGQEVIEIVDRAPVYAAPPAAASVDRDELLTTPGSRGDAMQVIKSLPGVANVSAAGPGPGAIVIRGAAPEDSVYLVDGIQIPLVYHFFGLQSIIPSELIERIDFSPGGFGVEEGRATGGVIEIHTRPSSAEHISGFAEVSFINVAGFLQGPVSRANNLDVAIGFRRSLIDAVLPLALPADGDVSLVTAPQYYDGQLRLDWRPRPGHRLTLLGLGSFDRTRLLNDADNQADPMFSGAFDNQTSFGRLMATWKFESPELEQRAVVALGDNRLAVEVGDSRHLRLEDRTLTVREDLRWRPASRLSLRAGGDLALRRGHADVVFPLPPQEGTGDLPNFTTDSLIERDEDFENNRASAYAAVDISPLRKLQLTAGLRLDHYSQLGVRKLQPRLSGTFAATDRLALKAAAGSYSRPFESAEAAADGLAPETARHYVGGIELRGNQGFRLSSSVFYNQLEDLVVQDAAQIQGDAIDAYVNRGSGRSYGAEFLLRARTGKFFGWISYTLSRAERDDGQRMDTRLFDFDQTHNFIVLGSWQWRSWRLGGRWQYTTGTPFTPVQGSVFLSDLNAYAPVFGAPNSRRLEAAHQLDLRVDRRWRFESWSLSAYLDLTNAYAHAQTVGYQYSFDYGEREAVTSLPIMPAFGLRGEI